MSLRLVIQAAYFVLLARSLGPDAYGAFVAVVAMAGVLAPFSGMGTANLFIKNVRSDKREAAVCWGNGMLLTLLSGTLFTALVVGLVYLFHLKTGPFVVIVVCISDLVFMKVTELAGIWFCRIEPNEASAPSRVWSSAYCGSAASRPCWRWCNRSRFIDGCWSISSLAC